MTLEGEGCLHSNPSGMPPCVDHKVFQCLRRLRVVLHEVDSWCLAHSTFFFVEKWRKVFQFSSIPTKDKHGPYKRRLKNCFKGWSLVRPSLSVRHIHCVSMTALEHSPSRT